MGEVEVGGLEGEEADYLAMRVESVFVFGVSSGKCKKMIDERGKKKERISMESQLNFRVTFEMAKYLPLEVAFVGQGCPLCSDSVVESGDVKKQKM